jgi:ribosomal protein S18 acetylase RimI-like enzyme
MIMNLMNKKAAPRQAIIDDVPAIVEIRRRSFFTAMPHMPVLHTPEEELAFVSNVVFPNMTIWLIEEADTPVGFIAYRKDWVEQFYIDPLHQGRGHGPNLLAIAKSEYDSFNLWTFQCNQRARRFYEKHGFQVVRMTDGSDNEERQPDVLYSWVRDGNASVPPNC